MIYNSNPSYIEQIKTCKQLIDIHKKEIKHRRYLIKDYKKQIKEIIKESKIINTN